MPQLDSAFDIDYLSRIPDRTDVLKKTAIENLHVLAHPIHRNPKNINYRKELIKKVQKILLINRNQAEIKLNTLINKLQASKATLNFPIEHLLNDDFLKSGSYKSCWNLPEKANQNDYLQIRAETEEYFWGYDLSKANKIIDNYSKNKISHKRQKSIRPIYGALNITDNEGGAAPGYGLAYFILKPATKYRSTFVPEDSYNLYQVIKLYNKNDQPNADLNKIESCQFDELTKLLFYMDDKKFYRLLTNQMLYDDYVEMQVHGEVRFEEDIEEVVILWDAPDNNKNTPFSSLSHDERERIRTRVTDFAVKNHIKAKIIDDKGNLVEMLQCQPADRHFIIPTTIPSRIPDSRIWKFMSYHFASSRKKDLKEIDKLVADYDSLKHHGNLTTRLINVIVLQEKVALWLSTKNASKEARFQSMTKLLKAIELEHKNLSKALSGAYDEPQVKPKTSDHYENEAYYTACVKYEKFLKKKIKTKFVSLNLQQLIDLYQMTSVNGFDKIPRLPEDLSEVDLRIYLISHILSQLINTGLNLPNAAKITKIIGKETTLDIEKQAIIKESRFILRKEGKTKFKNYLIEHRIPLLTKQDHGFKTFLKGLGVLGATIFGFGVGGYFAHRKLFGAKASTGHQFLHEVKQIQSQYRKR